MTVTRGWGLFGCVGQLVGLVALLFIVALGADFGLRKAVSSLRGLDIGASVAAHRAAARRDLPPFLVEGPDESWMQVVVAADLSKPGQVRAVGRLLTRLHEAWQADILPHGRAPRLVFLPKLEPGDGSTDLAAAILALSHQTDFWSWLRNVAARGEAVSVANIRASMAAADLDLKRFADDRTDPDAVLRCRTWSTMAAGLGLADAVAAVNGRVTKASDLASDKAADAFIRRAADVAGEARAVHGDDISAAHATLVAHMPERTAQRWLQWIVRGERVPTRPLAEVPAKTAVEVEEAPREAIEPPPGAASMGSPKAPVTVLVFIDFHCPFSQRHAVNYRRLIKDFGGDIRLAIAHFPIKTLHADSKAAATLAISAQAQGMFWPAHDLLFERADDDWDDAAMVRLLAATAKESGMRFRRGRLRTNRKRRAAKVVRAHRKLGKKHGVNGTPYTFINGRPLRGAVPYKKLRALVEDELRQVAVPEPAETP